MAKIEKPQALIHLADILDVSDAIMVARGDLGVELPIEQVPARKADDARRPAHRKTRRGGNANAGIDDHQPVPSRAEVSDVATAIFEGADAVMLSASPRQASFRSRRSP